MKDKYKSKLIGAIVVAVLLILWIIDSKLQLIDERFLPSIGSVWKALVTVSIDGYKGTTLLGHLGASFFRLFTAFFAAILTAVPLGLLSGYNKTVRAAFDPIIEFYRPLPPLEG